MRMIHGDGYDAMRMLHPIPRRLLEKRGLTDEDEIVRFLAPDYERDMHDPFLLPDMERAVLRILAAIEARERITIFTDYDTDGIPAGVVLHDFFVKIGYNNFENYIPHRHKEGYGLNIPAIEGFARAGTTLMITADCGITDVAQVMRAQELGIDVVLTDHHLPGEVLPPAYAVINHKRADNAYPFPELCGCAIAWKLVCALLARGRERGMFAAIPLGWEKWLLDMVGISTIADMVPLTGENRMLARYGITVLRKSPRLGLQAILRAARVRQHELGEDDVGFVIGPRINAASRMDVPRRAFEALSSRDPIEATERAAFLEKLNNRRKGVVASIIKEARHRLADREIREVIVMGDPRWAPGILGLAASSLVAEYGRPVFLWGRGDEGETIKGSCRTDGTISVVACMTAASDALLGFGGHHASGGFSVAHDAVHLLEDALVAAYHTIEKNVLGDTSQAHDEELTLAEADFSLLAALDALAPFGQGNPRPVFLFRSVRIGEVATFGKEGQHIKLTLTDDTGVRIQAISFFSAHDPSYAGLEATMRVDVVGSLERDQFAGRRAVRIRLLGVERI